jgi:cytoskeleton protein RodZ
MNEPPMNSGNSEQAMTGPGELLRETRVKLGLEPENVAQILHLSINQIAALENNDFDRLPGATYVRGYLRSYCQLLNIDAAPVLKAFEAATGDWKTTTYSNLVTERQVTSRDSIVRVATFGIALLVVGLAVVWWFGKGRAPAPVVDISSEEAAPALAPAASEAPEPAVTGTEMQSTAAPAEAAPGPADSRDTSAETTTQAASPRNPPSAPVATVAPSAEPRPAPPPVTVDRPAPAPAAAGGEHARLVISTSAPSWLDIRDGGNNRLLYETVAAGRTISLEGDPPFQVFVGNVDGVSLSFDGKPVDMESHRNGPTARFTLGSSASGDTTTN